MGSTSPVVVATSSAAAVARRQIPFGRPMIGEAEREAVLRVLSGSTLTHGPLVRQFESAFAQFTGAPHAVAVSNCTAALHLALLALGLNHGDEVIVPAQTHVATAHAVELCGARCVFVDSEPITGNVDPDAVEAALNNRTRGIAIVHYLGVPADVLHLREMAREYNLFLVEDCALALGTRMAGVHAGLHGDVGCFSFYPVKHMTTAEGGMIATRHARLAEEVSRTRAFGIDRNIVSQRQLPGMYDVQQLGFNYRMNELSAALGIEQLKRLPEFLAARRHNFTRLRHALAEIEHVSVLPSEVAGGESSYYCLQLLLDDVLRPRRDRIIEQLAAAGVGTSIYYPRPVPEMDYYRSHYPTRPGAFPVAARLSHQSIALPVAPHVSDEDVDYMAAALRQVISKELGS